MKPEYWDGYAYPEDDKKLWISFSSGPDGKVIILISKYDMTPVNGPREIPCYSAVAGDWKDRDDVIADANNLADTIIREKML
ncbi:hypothetical protein QEP73_15150 [Pseudomonas defluvii]|nr:hypothetical protein QEP73_15150 [Pseudomonas defluvii]